jgi:hypothetical protein
MNYRLKGLAPLAARVDARRSQARPFRWSSSAHAELSPLRTDWPARWALPTGSSFSASAPIRAMPISRPISSSIRRFTIPVRWSCSKPSAAACPSSHPLQRGERTDHARQGSLCDRRSARSSFAGGSNLPGFSTQRRARLVRPRRAQAARRWSFEGPTINKLMRLFSNRRQGEKQAA